MGWIDEEKIVCEMASRSIPLGAQIYLTYYAEDLAKLMEKGESDDDKIRRII